MDLRALIDLQAGIIFMKKAKTLEALLTGPADRFVNLEDPLGFPTRNAIRSLTEGRMVSEEESRSMLYTFAVPNVN
jgi:hypothetical protein